jgi:hypothetical protein
MSLFLFSLFAFSPIHFFSQKIVDAQMHFGSMLCYACFGFAMDIGCHYHLHPLHGNERGVNDQRVE